MLENCCNVVGMFARSIPRSTLPKQTARVQHPRRGTSKKERYTPSTYLEGLLELDSLDSLGREAGPKWLAPKGLTPTETKQVPSSAAPSGLGDRLPTPPSLSFVRPDPPVVALRRATRRRSRSRSETARATPCHAPETFESVCIWLTNVDQCVQRTCSFCGLSVEHLSTALGAVGVRHNVRVFGQSAKNSDSPLKLNRL